MPQDRPKPIEQTPVAAAGRSNLDLPANSTSCEGDSACEKLLADSSGSIFKIQADNTTAVGWVGPDGRLITNYHAIMGKREITAEDNRGKVYRLGKDIAIDDVKDLAALSFVDGTPKGARHLEITTNEPQAGDQVRLLSPRYGWAGHKLGEKPAEKSDPSVEMSTATFVRKQTMVDSYDTGSSPKLFAENPAQGRIEKDSLLRDQEAFLGQTMFDFKIAGKPGYSGTPLFDKTGKVVSMTSNKVFQDNHQWSIPASGVSDLLYESLSRPKFKVTSGYETGVSNSINRLRGDDKLSAISDTLLNLGGLCSIARVALGGTNSPLLRAGALYVAGKTFQDGRALSARTNKRDVLANGLAIAGDATLAASLAARYIPAAKNLSPALLGLGASLKAGAEFVPNHYTIQHIERTNLDPRLPFLDSLKTPPKTVGSDSWSTKTTVPRA